MIRLLRSCFICSNQPLEPHQLQAAAVLPQSGIKGPPPRGWPGLNHPPCSSPPPLLHLGPSHCHAACPGPALPQQAGLWFTDGPSLLVPAERHPSLSLEVLQAEKSIYPPGTWAWSLPTTISGWQPALGHQPCSRSGGSNRAPLQTSEPKYVLICPQREARPHQKLQANPDLGKYRQREATHLSPGCPAGTFPRWSSNPNPRVVP